MTGSELMHNLKTRKSNVAFVPEYHVRHEYKQLGSNLHGGEWPHNNTIAFNLTSTTLPVANREEERQFSVSFCTRGKGE
jgi:hypothetical protein